MVLEMRVLGLFQTFEFGKSFQPWPTFRGVPKKEIICERDRFLVKFDDHKPIKRYWRTHTAYGEAEDPPQLLAA